MSGRTERIMTKGILRFVFSNFAAGLAMMYASAMCPTANEAFSSLEAKNPFDSLLNV